MCALTASKVGFDAKSLIDATSIIIVECWQAFHHGKAKKSSLHLGAKFAKCPEESKNCGKPL